MKENHNHSIFIANSSGVCCRENGCHLGGPDFKSIFVFGNLNFTAFADKP